MKALLCLALLQLLGHALTYRLYQDRIPNGGLVPHPCLTNYLWHGVGHKNVEGGGDRNVFGTAFAAAGYQWTAALCQADSDGDGMTNGQELGDPNCVWSVGSTPAQNTGITHPGVCEPINSTACAAVNNWDFCSQAAFNCSQTEAADVQNITLSFNRTAVPATETNYYCQLFDLPNATDYHIIADQPAIDNEYVMHHILLFGCGSDTTGHLDTFYGSPKPCSMQAQGTCGVILAGWTVGQVGSCNTLPAAVRIGQTTYSRALLQFHWNNPTLRSDYTDASGLTLHYTSTLRQYDLGTLTVGQVGLRIPGGQTSYAQEATCTSACTASKISTTMNMVYINLHMHYKGKEGYLYQYRNGALVNTLASDTTFSYDSPTTITHWPAKELLAGDELKVRCVFKSTSHSNATYYGDGTSNEMCFAFIGYYPAQNFTSCVSAADQLFCGTDALQAYNGCNYAQAGEADEVAAYTQMLTQCDTTGATCTPGCKSLLTENPHVCLTGTPKKVYEFLGGFVPTIGTTGQTAMRSCDSFVYDSGAADARPGGLIGLIVASLLTVAAPGF